MIHAGIGLRPAHYTAALNTGNKPAFFEVISENFMGLNFQLEGRPLEILEKIRTENPLALHGVSLSIASTDPLNEKYLASLKRLTERLNPFLITDHLCWNQSGRHALHDLLPFPLCPESLDALTPRIHSVQEFLGRPILLENISSYVAFKSSEIPEWEFFNELGRRTGCGMLLDLNNVYVNSVNHGFDAFEFIGNIRPGIVGQYHLAGHSQPGRYLFDSHDHPVPGPVWELFEHAVKIHGAHPTLVEWDDQLPEYPDLLREAEKAEKRIAESKDRHFETVAH